MSLLCPPRCPFFVPMTYTYHTCGQEARRKNQLPTSSLQKKQICTMAKLTLAEKLEKKRLLEEKREARRLAKEKKEQEKASAAAAAATSSAATSASPSNVASADSNESTSNSETTPKKEREATCYIFQLSDDTINHLFWYLSSRDLGSLTSTCRHMSKALVHGRYSYAWDRLTGGTVRMCADKVEAETLVQQAYTGGGDTGKVSLKGKARKEFAADFVSYARFLDEATIGYAKLDTGNSKSPITLPRFVNGRFVSTSPEHSLIRVGGGDRVGAGGSGIASYGIGKRGQLGNGKRQDQPSPLRLMGGIGYKIRIVQVSAGGGLARISHSLLLTSTGQVLSYGCGQYGALGHGFSGGKQLPDVLRPKYIEALRRERCVCVSAGELHSAVVTADGDLYTFGDNFCGQLGLGSKRPQVEPHQCVLGGLEDEVVEHVACGARHTLAVTDEGQVYSFGLGHYGVLGRSFTPYEHEPDAALAGMGEDEDGGDGELNDIRNAALQGDEAAVPQPPAPMASAPPNIDDLMAHLDLIGNKELKDSSNQCIPKLIDSLEGIKIVGASAGHRHSLFLDDKGMMYSCGNGKTGCLGHGDNFSQMYPLRIRAFDVQGQDQTSNENQMKTGIQIMQMSAGVDMSMAVDTTGRVWAWGKTDGGRLGLGLQKSFVNTPHRVSILSSDGNGGDGKRKQDKKAAVPLKAVDVECGYVHSMIVALNGTVHVCGGVGIDGDADGSSVGSDGTPQQLPNLNIWHRLKEPKEASVTTARWKKYGTYEVKGRSKNV